MKTVDNVKIKDVIVLKQLIDNTMYSFQSKGILSSYPFKMAGKIAEHLKRKFKYFCHKLNQYIPQHYNFPRSKY